MKYKIIPETGKEYMLFDSESEKEQKSFEGIYIGKNPIVTISPWFMTNSKTPEGHTFIRRSSEGRPEIYFTGTEEESIGLRWYSDGEDGPDWPAGFSVHKLDSEYLSGPEKDSLEERLKRFEEQKHGRAA